MTPLCFIDTETDGVHPDRRAWEIALIRRDDAGQRETSFFVDVDLSTADPFGLKVGRFYERHPYGRYLSGVTQEFPNAECDGRYVSPRAAAETVARWTHGAHLIGAVPNFDTEVFAALLRAHQLTPAWHYHICDAENLALGYIRGRFELTGVRPEGWPFQPPWKSDDLSRAVGVGSPSDEERHTALGDARWAMRIWDVVMGTSAPAEPVPVEVGRHG